MAELPPWVVDHVIVHELAHLAEADHGPAFRALVARNPLAERAEGYLLAVEGGRASHGDPADADLMWAPYVAADDNAALLDIPTGTINGVRTDQCDFWDMLLP